MDNIDIKSKAFDIYQKRLEAEGTLPIYTKRYNELIVEYTEQGMSVTDARLSAYTQLRKEFPYNKHECEFEIFERVKNNRIDKIDRPRPIITKKILPQKLKQQTVAYGSIKRKKKLSIVGQIKWVAEHIMYNDLEPKDFPDSVTYGMYCQYTLSDDTRSEFWNKVFPRIMPKVVKKDTPKQNVPAATDSPKQPSQEDSMDHFDDDKRTQFQIIEELTKSC